MSMMLWKTLALGGVIGVGSVVVVQAKRSLDRVETDPNAVKSLDEQYPLVDDQTGLETSFTGLEDAPPKKLPQAEAARAMAELNPADGDENPFGGEPSPSEIAKASAEVPSGDDPFSAGAGTTPAGQSEPATLTLDEPSQDQFALLDPNAKQAAPPQTEPNPFAATQESAAPEVEPVRPLRKLSPGNDGPVLMRPPAGETVPAAEPEAPAADNPFAQFSTSPKSAALPEVEPAAEASPFETAPASNPPPLRTREPAGEAPLELPPATLNPEKAALRNRQREQLPEQTEPEVASRQDAGLAAPQAPRFPDVAPENAPGRKVVAEADSGSPFDPAPGVDLTAGQTLPRREPRQPVPLPVDPVPAAPPADSPSTSPFDRTIPNEASSIPAGEAKPLPGPATEPAAQEPPPSFPSQAPPSSEASPFNLDESPTARPSTSIPAATGFPASEGAPAASSIPIQPAEAAGSPFDNPPITLPPAPITPAPVKTTPAVQPDFTGAAVLDRNVATGPSQPQLTIVKQAPSEAVIGQDLEYSILVKNIGRSAAHNVVVEDLIPRGSKCMGTIPKAESQVEKKNLIWKLGTLAAGAEQLIRVKITPTDVGEIGSVATVSFSAEVAAKTVIVEPKATLTLAGPREAVVGEPAQFRFTVTNNGPVDLKGLFVRTVLPAQGLTHPGGSDLEYEVGDLPRGKSREVALAITPAQPGGWKFDSMVNLGSRELAKAQAELHVVGARLAVVRSGPTKRFVGRSATYSNTVTNNSSQMLTNVSVVETLPTGLDPAGQLAKNVRWDPSSRTLSWVIPQLAPGQSIDLPCTVMPKVAGALQGQLVARDATGNRAEIATALDVAGFSSLVVDGGHDGRPVAVGDQVSFRFSVTNRGTAPAEKVVAMFDLPDEVEFVSAQGPGNLKYQRDGRVVLFEAVPMVPVNSELSYDVVVQAKAATPVNGDQRVLVKLYSNQLPTDRPLEQEQQLVIYGDDEEPQPVQRVSGLR